jgi:hypothetical protein
LPATHSFQSPLVIGVNLFSKINNAESRPEIGTASIKTYASMM